MRPLFAPPTAAGYEKHYRAAVKLESSGEVVGALAAFEAIPQVPSRSAPVRLRTSSPRRQDDETVFEERGADGEAVDG